MGIFDKDPYGNSGYDYESQNEDRYRHNDARDEAEYLIRKNPFLRRMIDDMQQRLSHYRHTASEVRELEDEVKALKAKLKKYESDPKKRGIKIADEIGLI